MFRVLLQSAAVAAMTCFSMSAFTASAQALEVYMFKGAGDFSFVNENMHFSRGLNKISKKLNAEGIRSEVRRFGAVDQALNVIRKRKPKSIALVGHSMGALASMSLARSLKEDGIDIAYMALLDIPGPVGVAGANVEWVQNYYTIHPVYAKLTNVRSHPNAKNINILGYMQNRLDDAPKVQNGILAAIRKVHEQEQRELTPQPETLFVEQRSIDQTNVASIAQQPTVSQPVGNQAPDLGYVPPKPDQQLDAGSKPYVLPSVRPLAGVGVQTIATPPLAIDPVTTADIAQPLATSRTNVLKNPKRKRFRDVRDDVQER